MKETNISLLDEIIRRLQLSLKCMDSELQCVFESYEIEDMINKLITIKQLNDFESKDDEDEEKKIPDKILEDEFDELTKEGKLWKLFYKYNKLIDYLEKQRKGE